MNKIGLALAVGVLGATVAVATPAHASCTVNHYRVSWSYSDLYDDPGFGYIKTKLYDQVVTGPNSNVTTINYGVYRKVYYTPTGSFTDGVGWMNASSLSYRYCT
jgi:hypothetical protein